MAKLTKTNEKYEIELTEEEAKLLGFEKTRKMELIKAKNTIWIMTCPEEKENKETQQEDLEIEEKIITMLKTLPAREKMETWFEKKLNEKERKKFNEMLEQGKIIKFKTSQVFRKALYGLGKTDQKKQYENREKNPAEYTMEKDGFVIVKSEATAKQISEQNKDKIKEGKIRGIKSFTGEYYIIDGALLQESQKKILAELMKETKQNITSLSEKTKLTPTLVRIATEFLKEEGQIIEKKKDYYQYID